MKNNNIEELIPSWFEGTLSQEEREKVKQWKALSEENRQIFTDSLRAWEGMEQLRRMKKYDPEKAIRQVNSKIEKHKRIRLFDIFQRVAAILILPLIVATLWFALEKPQKTSEPFVAWHTLETPAGMRSEFVLPDSTKVYLNSNTSLSYPLVFSNTFREVKVSGQAYFEVAENKKVPFIVTTGKINVEVTGTEFMTTNYKHEKLTEIVLIEGGINLFQGDYLTSRKNIVKLEPGHKAFLEVGNNELVTTGVDKEKYLAWKNGILIFRNDPMPEVVLRLNRWFNVDIKLVGNELKDYVYTATFEEESLTQILELLKISAPIDYSIKQREQNKDDTFSKMEIIIKQR